MPKVKIELAAVTEKARRDIERMMRDVQQLAQTAQAEAAAALPAPKRIGTRRTATHEITTYQQPGGETFEIRIPRSAPARRAQPAPPPPPPPGSGEDVEAQLATPPPIVSRQRAAERLARLRAATLEAAAARAADEGTRRGALAALARVGAAVQRSPLTQFAMQLPIIGQALQFGGRFGQATVQAAARAGLFGATGAAALARTPALAAAAGAGASVAIGVVAAAVGAVVVAAKLLTRWFTELTNATRNLTYTFVATGAPRGFTAFQQVTAQALGVSPNQVWELYPVWARYRERLGRVARTQAEMERFTPVRTDYEVSVQERKAAFQKMTADMSAGWTILKTWVNRGLAKAFEGMTWLNNKMAGFGWVNPIGAGLTLIGRHAGKDAQTPTLQPLAPRLPASPWERMGLVLGVPTGDALRAISLYSAQTARNTEQMVNLLRAGMPRGEQRDLPAPRLPGPPQVFFPATVNSP
jgi:hypothetical protein